MHAIVADRLDRSFFDQWMAVEAEVILAGEIHAFEQQAVVGARSASRERTLLRRAAKRPQPGVPARILPVEEGCDPVEQVRARQMAVIAHAAAQGVRSGHTYRFGGHTSASFGRC